MRKRGIYLADPKHQRLAEPLPNGLMPNPFYIRSTNLVKVSLVKESSEKEFLANGECPPEDHYKNDPTYNLRRTANT